VNARPHLALVLAALALTPAGSGCGSDDGEKPKPKRQAVAGQKVGAADQAAIRAAIANYLAAARSGNAERFCGEQSDARLRRLYGGLNGCLGSAEARKPERSLPAVGQLRAADALLSRPRRAVEALITRDGRRRYVFAMVDERGPGGWAIDEITATGR
jgi:hypothetical protein